MAEFERRSNSGSESGFLAEGQRWLRAPSKNNSSEHLQIFNVFVLTIRNYGEYREGVMRTEVRRTTRSRPKKEQEERAETCDVASVCRGNGPVDVQAPAGVLLWESNSTIRRTRNV